MILTGIMVIHIGISLLIVFTGNKNLIGYSAPSKAYVFLVHLGPFFREEALEANPSLIVTTYRNKLQKSDEIFSGLIHSYYEKPWKTHQLLLKDFIRTESNRMVSVSDSAKQVSKLSGFILRNYGRDADSVYIQYDGRYMDIHTNTLRSQNFFRYKLLP